jgi:hypothetical protein
MTISRLAIENSIVALLEQRAKTASICPSDVARALVREEDEWRALMPLVREVAAKLAREGQISITQGEMTLHPDLRSHGPIRLRRGSQFPHR